MSDSVHAASFCIPKLQELSILLQAAFGGRRLLYYKSRSKLVDVSVNNDDNEEDNSNDSAESDDAPESPVGLDRRLGRGIERVRSVDVQRQADLSK